MRRTLPVLLISILLLAACGSDGDSATDGSTVESADTIEPVPESSEPVTDASTPAAPATNPDKPEVEIPDEIPTELVVTVLEEGTGPEAQAGDTVVVDYV
ncbi:MAG TPA: hypothetical protein VES40_13370, partial [Ilumatobacteraceae bacterium]|nr:hypothetical protein [Ilumatobacteraceae bacterium]